MALRDSPYLPLYVQDYLTDEKLSLCSASSQGVYIKILCILHKTDEYGCLLLRQKDQQKGSKLFPFAAKLAKLLPFEKSELETALTELVDEGVLQLEKNKLWQKRMVKDFAISTIRSKTGSKGGAATNAAKRSAKKPANDTANSDIDNESDNESNIKEQFRKKFFENDVLNLAFQQWLSSCAENRKLYSPSSIQALQMQMNSKSDEQNIAEVNQSLRNNWKNLRAVQPEFVITKMKSAAEVIDVPWKKPTK